MNIIKRYLTLPIILALAPLLAGAQGNVVESKKTLPLAYDVDVVVAGGSLAGVEAACAAADAGAKRRNNGAYLSRVQHFG